MEIQLFSGTGGFGDFFIQYEEDGISAFLYGVANISSLLEQVGGAVCMLAYII